MMLIIACLTGGLVYLNAASDLNKIAARTITPRGPLTDEENSTIAIFEHAKKSVVFISTKQRVRDHWTRNIFSVPSGTGSG